MEGRKGVDGFVEWNGGGREVIIISGGMLNLKRYRVSAETVSFGSLFQDSMFQDSMVLVKKTF